jgi:peptide-methionine (S)-S-oxide reductase
MKTLSAVLCGLILMSLDFASAKEWDPRYRKATFAAGCFWCIQPVFDKTPGVKHTEVGYTGGQEANPSYKQVSSGLTSHAEAVQVVYDPTKVTYDALLDIFWDNINPTTKDQQFVDRGRQYRTVIFYHDEEQRLTAEASKAKQGTRSHLDSPIVTEIVPASSFWPAEDYHQKYYLKSPEAYQQYSDHSGRKEYFERRKRKNR